MRYARSVVNDFAQARCRAFLMILCCTSRGVNRPIYCVQAHSVTSTPALSGIRIKIVVLRVYSPSSFDIHFAGHGLVAGRSRRHL